MSMRDDQIILDFLARATRLHRSMRLLYEEETLYVTSGDVKEPWAIWWRDQPVLRKDITGVFTAHTTDYAGAQMTAAIMVMAFKAMAKNLNIKFLVWDGILTYQILEEALLSQSLRGLDEQAN
jgi:hypothetical protein